MTDWLPRDAALARLGVKPQTLYAYVSRGRVRTRVDPADSRRSLFNAGDIAALTVRRARGRRPAAIAASSMAWGEPAIATGLSAVKAGQLYYRGRAVAALVRGATLEAVAGLLWDCPAPRFAAPPPPAATAFAALAALAEAAPPMLGRARAALVGDAAAIVGTLAAVAGAAAGTAPVHVRLARGWGRPAAAPLIGRALIAMADHDLNASTFACRVAAATGAPLPAAVLAGLCALSGPRHGGAAAALATLLATAAQLGNDAAIARWRDTGLPPPGFGHPLYPEGDPRAAWLLEAFDPDPRLAGFAAAMTAHTGLLPNCDFALAALAAAHDLPADAPFRLFLVGRSVGWCAHAIEQLQSGELIRPRGRYEGPALP